jgi:hypothetical protein
MNNGYKMDITEFIDTVNKMYSVLNGWVNINKSLYIDIQFGLSLNDPMAFTTYGNAITINIYRIYNYLSKRKFYRDAILTIILDIIVHELSHLDQCVDHMNFGNNPTYIKMIEQYNIINSSRFIIRNREKLEKIFGFTIRIDGIIANSNINPFQGYKNIHSQYEYMDTTMATLFSVIFHFNGDETDWLRDLSKYRYIIINNEFIKYDYEFIDINIFNNKFTFPSYIKNKFFEITKMEKRTGVIESFLKITCDEV